MSFRGIEGELESAQNRDESRSMAVVARPMVGSFDEAMGAHKRAHSVSGGHDRTRSGHDSGHGNHCFWAKNKGRTSADIARTFT